MGMHYEYDPGFLLETNKRETVILWEVTQNPGKLFYAQIQAFEKIFRQPSGFYNIQADVILLIEPAKLKVLIEAMLYYWHPMSYPLTPLMFNLPIQMLLVLYQRAIGEWLPAPAELMANIEQIEIAMGRS